LAKAKTATSDPLARYREKRTLERTPEPAGSRGGGVRGTRLFVVHKHAARHLHFDLRLEMDGVLRSWAVPKGPSYDTADKRLAVLVEDHPIEYGGFEGRIPEGNYGAGGVIIWDRGRWTPVGDPDEGLAKGKLLFRLDGFKLHGMWTLVKLKKGEKEWLLIKERDGFASPGGRPVPETSVLSGRTVEDVKDGTDLEARLLSEFKPREAPARAVRAKEVDLMLAETAERAFTREGWLFELKLDGYRILAEKQGRDVMLRARAGGDMAAAFPEITASLAALPYSSVLLDGELVVLDEGGRPSFGRLQERARLRRPADIARATIELPATYFAFDLLAVAGRDLRGLPLSRRKEFLTQVAPAAGPLRSLDHVETEGERFYEQIERMGLEGLVAKRADAPYRGGRSPSWLKLRAARTEDLIVIGFTPPQGSRTGLGALQLAHYVGDELRYAGRVGTGFSDSDLRALRAELEPDIRATPPATGVPKTPKGSTWVEPRRVCEVRFTEWTKDGLLRQPVFVRWRDDKTAEMCRSAAVRAAPPDPPADPPARAKRPAAAPAAAPAPHSGPLFTNLTKVFWPAEGYTKGDLINYYREVSHWMLPYLKDRPVVLTRFPDGIEGKSFYQKDAPESTPEWVRTEPVWSEDAGREIRYLVCDDLDTLLFIANLGSIPLHLWGSRVGALEKPDWCVIDLDPKGAPFANVVTIARRLHEICDTVKLPAFVKTTGKSGLHIMIPLGGQCTWDQCRTIGELLARMVLRTLGKIATITRTIDRRHGKVYLDYLQNRRGQLIAAPFCVRPEPGAPVSMPLKWEEVNARLDPKKFTMANAVSRMKRLGKDPVAPVLHLAPDLAGAISALA